MTATSRRLFRPALAITFTSSALVLSVFVAPAPASIRPFPGAAAPVNSERRGGVPSLVSGLPAFLAQSMTFISNDDGWLLGAARCPTGWCTAVRKTTDRGRHWSAVPSPPAPISENSSPDITELRFANASDGFAFDPGLWVTHDAAAHWHRVNLHGAVLALATSAGMAYAVVAPCWPFTSAKCSSPTRLYRSPVGADAWNEVPGVVLPDDQEDVVLDVRGSAVDLLVGGTKYFVGATNGRHFAKLTDPCPSSRTGPGYVLDSLALPAAKTLAVLCGDGVAAGSEGKKVYVSTDDGRTFRQVATPPFEGDVGELAAGSPTTLVMTARSGASWVFRTSGADTKWTTSLTFGDGGLGLGDLSFTDSTHGAVIHALADFVLSFRYLGGHVPDLGTLFLTDNGGISWQPVVVDG